MSSNEMYRATERYQFGWTDWRGVYDPSPQRFKFPRISREAIEEFAGKVFGTAIIISPLVLIGWIFDLF